MGAARGGQAIHGRRTFREARAGPSPAGHFLYGTGLFVPPLHPAFDLLFCMAMSEQAEENTLYLSAGDAHLQAMSLPIGQIVAHLLELLDATTVAVIAGVHETRAVHSWLGDREPQRPQVLRFALQLAAMIATAADAEICKAWFHGSNPHLDDQVPMIILRDRPLPEIQRELLAAARVFAARSNS